MSENSLSLYTMTSDMMALLEAEDIDDKLIEAAFGNIQTKGNSICHFIRNIESAITAHKDEETRISNRRKAMENKVGRLKEYVKFSMERLEVDELQAGTFTLKIQNNPPSVEVIDEIAIPSRFFTIIPSTKQLDKKRLLDELKNGTSVAGCQITRGRSLRIR